MVLKGLLGVWVAVCIYLAFLWAPEMVRPNFGTNTMEPWPTFRIVFFHVPAAWICVLAFGVSMGASIAGLRRYTERRDDLAMATSQIGLVFATLALVSGMIWARRDWGTFWNWDPRESSVLIILLIYAGYFALRSAVPEPRRRARLAAVYSIVAFVPALLLIFVVPRIMTSLHPSPVIPVGENKGSMNGTMRVVLYSMVFGYIGLAWWVITLRIRIEELARVRASRRGAGPVAAAAGGAR